MRNNKILCVLMFTVFVSLSAEAKIWRLNNNGNGQVPVISSDFPVGTTLQQAHDNASVVSGDTIHIEQSPTTYGNCIFTKRLVIIGAGYYLEQNPNTQVNRDYGSLVGDLTFYNVNSASSKVMGLRTGNIFMGVANLAILRCHVNGGFLIGNTTTGDIDNMSIRQCLVTIGANYYATVRNNTGTGQVSNLSIENNLFIPSLSTFNSAINLDSRVSGIIKNNTIQSYQGAITAYNFYVLNNIVHAGGGNAFYNCVIEYNTGLAASHFVTPAGTNNTIGLGNATRTLANIAYVGGASTDGYYQLQPTSQVLTAGKNALPQGAFGGDYPYKLSGIAPVPNIYVITVAPIVQGASTINVHITAKGNN